MLVDRTAIPQNEIKFPNVPGVQWPYHVPGGMRNDLIAGPISVLPFLLPRVDQDGNVISGLRLPEQSVPLGTYGDGHSAVKALASRTRCIHGRIVHTVCEDQSERQRSADPRLSIEERYASRADYLKLVEDAANKLATQRYLLAEDVQSIVKARVSTGIGR